MTAGSVYDRRAMLTIEPDDQRKPVDRGKVEATAVLLPPGTMLHAWMTDTEGAAFVIIGSPDTLAGIRQQAHVIWDGDPVRVLWWDRVPTPALVPPGR